MRTSLVSASALLLSAVMMTGCSAIHTSTAEPTPVSLTGVHGILHGGQQPVSGASIQMFQVGTTGYGIGALPLLTTTVTSDANGNFLLTGKYTCTPGTQIYLTATGGNPGLASGTNNSALAMMAGLGLCDNLTSTGFIFVNEITTVAAVYALNPFMTSTATSVVIGAPTTNQSGLASAFTDIAQIANNATGITPGPALPVGAVSPTAEIDVLANILAGCINTASSSTPACASLFQYATTPSGSVPANTIAAALNIARNPSRNVANLIALGVPNAPFQPTLATTNDFTLGVTYPVGTAPSAVAVDSTNTLWIANNLSSSVTRLSHAGIPTTYAATTGGLSLPTGIAIDTTGNAWVVNTNNSLTRITSAGAGTNFTGGGLSAPSSVAIDGLGTIWVANGTAASLSAFTSAGAVASGSPFSVAPANGTGEVAVGINPR